MDIITQLRLDDRVEPSRAAMNKGLQDWSDEGASLGLGYHAISIVMEYWDTDESGDILFPLCRME